MTNKITLNDLEAIKELVYDKCNFEWAKFEQHLESTEYDACSYTLNGKTIQHRSSKITPTKVGQFVTIWKRTQKGIIAPFDFADDLDFIIITSKKEGNFGLFFFQKTFWRIKE
jgi:hypothetical protein